MSEDYDVLPYKELVSLKKEISEMKRKVVNTSSKELIDSMSKLTDSMDSMLQLFSSAAEEMKVEESTEVKIDEKLAPIVERLDQVLDQNKTIAEGLVAIADIIKNKASEPKMAPMRPEPAMPEMPTESFGLPSLDQPLPPTPDLPPLNPIGPPPGGMAPPRARKRSLFG